MTASYSYSDHPRVDLQNGDCLKQPEFHALYEAMPDSFRAELLDGTVFVSMPLKKPHAKEHIRLGTLLDTYAAHTTGVEALSEATVILGQDDEVQPDLLLRITPGCGGNCQDTYDEFLQGAPELVCEIAYSSRAIDLHLKRKRYAHAGVLEYIVFCLNPRELYWYDFANKTTIAEDENGNYCSKAFPGLWINRRGILEMSYHPVMDALTDGLSTDSHAVFCAQLAAHSKEK